MKTARPCSTASSNCRMPSDPSTAGSARVAQLRRTISLRCSKSADNMRAKSCARGRGRRGRFTTVYTRVPFERLDEPPGDYAIVAELLVRREYRRRGYARALLAHGERHAASQGAAELRIGVLAATRPRVHCTSTTASGHTSRHCRSPLRTGDGPAGPSPAIVRC